MKNNLVKLYLTKPGAEFARFTLCAVFTAFFITFFINPINTFAQESCGSITFLSGQEQSIEDCSNPFGSESVGGGRLIIEGKLVTHNQTIEITEEYADSYYPTQVSNYFSRDQYFRHDDSGYIEVETEYHELTEEDYWLAGEEFFGSREAADQYVRKEIGEDVDTESPTWDWGEYLDYYDYYNQKYIGWRASLPKGTYTAVFFSGVGGTVQVEPKSLFKKLFDLIIPTAYAQSYEFAYTTVTFTIANEPPVPEGPSSVLFLPGIMGSRLYEESDECNLFGGADKVERWFSAYDCDIERLLMDVNGESVNDIFTETEDGVIDEVAGQNLYKSFMADLEDWKEEEKIADYKLVPYDWRLRLDEILMTKNTGGRITYDDFGTYKDSYIYKSFLNLRDAAPNGKVVLIGHSNGGLVIKNLLATMKENNDQLLSAIDKVILVAVPQIGTPESVVGLLHGIKMGQGAVLSKEESRKLMNTSPFAYNLLPTTRYYDVVETPVINFEPGSLTDAWIEEFGNSLDTFDEVKAFVTKESGRDTPIWRDTHIPATIYSSLLSEAVETHNFLDSWRPDSIKIYEVGGMGIYTPVSITYFTDQECVRIEQGISGHGTCIFEPKLGYIVNEIIDGDGTVVIPSAIATPDDEKVEKWWVDLGAYDSLINLGRVHRDILEVDEVRKFVDGVIASTTSTYNYISKTEPNYDGEERIVYRLHSPLDLYVVLHDGAVVGSSTPYLRGIEYRQYGDVQSLSIPLDEEDYDIRLSGFAYGSFTFDIDEYTDNRLDGRTTYSAIPSSTSTEVVFRAGDSEFIMDYDGDGIFETVVTPGLGQMISTLPNEVATKTTSIATKNSGSSGTKVKDRNLPIVPLGVLTSADLSANQYELMLVLIKLLTQYRDLLIKLNVQ